MKKIIQEKSPFVLVQSSLPNSTSKQDDLAINRLTFYTQPINKRIFKQAPRATPLLKLSLTHFREQLSCSNASSSCDFLYDFLTPHQIFLLHWVRTTPIAVNVKCISAVSMPDQHSRKGLMFPALRYCVRPALLKLLAKNSAICSGSCIEIIKAHLSIITRYVITQFDNCKLAVISTVAIVGHYLLNPGQVNGLTSSFNPM
jgi:hypothetical protein